ncbi:alpha/beta hydrolase [Alteromonas sp. ASW11-130]|uniref:alpha/beta hydrolase n=1 Tax=Alteromonas sp. ASW11-130 TaxID=3015775 RepID=UPI002242BE77|nr:alpha/beta fold hydrolase [Alteromonas sp. ASW11-130]MCW8091639.1 alpha/beta fold hydrolase [Alteromonas sp. ASW11-130]
MRILWICICFIPAAFAKAPLEPIDGVFDKFASHYQQQLGKIARCRDPEPNQFRVCSPVLRNEGNAPFIMHHGQKTEKVAVLFHGLSDSPFYMRAIAEKLHAEGMNVLVPLTPGHGLRDADEAMEDGDMPLTWRRHVKSMIHFAPQLGDKIYLGGFSAGAAIATDYYLTHPEQIDALMLFSAALALSDYAESMSKIWGTKWLARLIDGTYQATGPNPHKYPGVSGYAGLQLMSIIHDIRNKLASGQQINVPVFAAHSQADLTTPLHGVEALLKHVKGAHMLFLIDQEYDLCHGDLPLDYRSIADMHFKKHAVTTLEKCTIPQANPLFRQMTDMLGTFVSMH